VKPKRPERLNSKSVAIIGAGPAGLAAAEILRSEGFSVTIFDRHDRAGGLLVYGIPNFKLDKSVVARRIGLLVDAGVEFRLGFEVGRDASLDDLRCRHDAVLIATGVYKARALECPVEPGAVVPALEYLTASNRKGLGDSVAAFDSGSLDARGKSVVVVGGGDTAMDCVRTAVRQGALTVTCLYRRDRANMPGSARETAHAEEEGVQFEWLTAPKSVAAAIRTVRMRLGQPDGSGRQEPKEIAGSEQEREADIVIAALGFEPEPLPALFGAPALKTNRRGQIIVDPETMETSIPGVFAAGDIVRGASLVVWAIRDGRLAARAISDRLSNESEARVGRSAALAAAE
jgi:glutamate synthase (NADPH/NADH) small chain